MHAPVELRQPFEVVIRLGIDVDHQRAAPLGLEGQQLGGDRLPGPERAGQQDRRRTPRPRGLGDVEAHRPRPAGQRAADVDAALRARLVRPDRHQRAELLDRQHVGVVAHRAAVRARQVIEEQRRLQAQRAMQRDRPEAVHERFDAGLELGGGGRADGQRDRAVQQRRPFVRLQVGVELARQLPVLLGRERQRTVRRVELLTEGDVGVDDPPAHARDRLAVPEPARMHDAVDRERQRLQRREQQLGAARERRLLRQRTQPQHGLVRATVLRIDDERAVLLEHRRVGVTHEVGAERLVGRPAVSGLDDQRGRLPVLVDRGLGDAAAGRATEQPLQLARRRPPHRQATLGAPERALLGDHQGIDLGRANRHRVRHPEQAFDPPARPVQA